MALLGRLPFNSGYAKSDNTHTPFQGRGHSLFWGYLESLESLLRSQGQEVFPGKKELCSQCKVWNVVVSWEEES